MVFVVAVVEVIVGEAALAVTVAVALTAVQIVATAVVVVVVIENYFIPPTDCDRITCSVDFRFNVFVSKSLST